MRVIGLSGGFGHDAAAALVVDGTPCFALEEERISRVKGAPWQVPLGAIRAALDAGECEVTDIDALAVSWDADAFADERMPAAYLARTVQAIGFEFGACPPIAIVPHHLAHATAAHLTSPFESGAVVVVDDRGEDRSGTVYSAGGTRLVERLVLPIRSSLGAMYTGAAVHVGLDIEDAGKLMGLAPYGEPAIDLPWLELTADGCRVRSDLVAGYGPPGRYPDWHAIFTRVGGAPSTGARRRREQLDDFTARHLALAASVQAALERAVAHLVDLAIELTGHTSVSLTGGVALNCTTNGKLRAARPGIGLHVLGAAGDAGAALGAALSIAIEDGDPRPAPLRTLALGVSASPSVAARRARELGLEVIDGERAWSCAARAVGAGAVGGWVRGRDEFGPRALGNRSIVARPDEPEVARRVNRLKGREAWRPLAPALDTDAAVEAGIHDHRGLDAMIEARWPSEPRGLCGTVHVDGSARPLLVDDDHAFGPLVGALRHERGTGAVLNTSFNVRGEPLVHTPLDALRTFCSSELDFLCVDDVLIVKPSCPGRGS